MEVQVKQPKIDFWIVPNHWPHQLKAEVLEVRREVQVNNRTFTFHPIQPPKRLGPGEMAATVSYAKGPVAVGNFHLRRTGGDGHGPHFELVVNDFAHLMDFEHDQILEQIVRDADKCLYPEDYALIS